LDLAGAGFLVAGFAAGFLAAGFLGAAFTAFLADAGLMAFTLLVGGDFLTLAAAAFPFTIGLPQQINSVAAHPHASSTEMIKPQAAHENKSPFLTLAMSTSCLIFNIQPTGLLEIHYPNYGNISIGFIPDPVPVSCRVARIPHGF
jgi:hypothetical protein